MRRINYRAIGLRSLAIFVAVFLFTVMLNVRQQDKVKVEAASLANFDPGYIISDYQMRRYTSMTEAEIQAFLTGKNSCSNTDTALYQNLSANNPTIKWHFENGHFVCLSEELFGDSEVIGQGETAAHIIWQAAQDYKINPQVLLVLLQKETGLITDKIPNNFDYRKATGYGCPDTAPCSEKYYGFKNQIRKAAALFSEVLNGGWTNYPLGNNYIQYNPSASCGGTVVNIKNLATSSLYRYTPYQPNAGALAAGYGTATCGAYGNRNFYLYFQDWFGGIQDEAPQRKVTEAAIKPTAIKAEQANGGLKISWTASEMADKYVVLLVDKNNKTFEKALTDAMEVTYYELPMNEYVKVTVTAVCGAVTGVETATFSVKLYKELEMTVEDYTGFSDMPQDATSKTAVSWAAQNGITDKNTVFNSEMAVTRRQMMVLLWRLAGQPAAGAYTGFSDMPQDATSKTAVSWAAQNGITDKNTVFNSEMAVTRRQMMVLLWRLAGQPAAGAYTGFSDMPQDVASKAAVSWAVQNDITDKNTVFNGGMAVTRRQAMILMMRFYQKLVAAV